MSEKWHVCTYMLVYKDREKKVRTRGFGNYCFERTGVINGTYFAFYSKFFLIFWMSI